LPVAVQESLPAIDVSGHIYDARPVARMVFINGNIHREGDMIAGNLQLLGITPNGVELSFRNTPFRMELFAMPKQGGN
ncbi:MAG: general secretion pathway protein GspB, partial [Mariprofundaceae bacterium]|nr:general secretion pathway protein GspB [Mariprofundaceae bacterium]